jgi:hypothetical protein
MSLGYIAALIFGDHLVFWSAFTLFGAYKVARILYGHQIAYGCCETMPSLIKDEEYDDQEEVEEEEAMKVE